ncbi:hypothetical protein KSP40_PGU011784 [Platanthera guangdongensis]|uniref:Uncharacterized protein n=1 Tax=Platanthera guangdongensis TaxID=2320717 RepID=A0ABR2LDH5_9ASPA
MGKYEDDNNEGNQLQDPWPEDWLCECHSMSCVVGRVLRQNVLKSGATREALSGEQKGGISHNREWNTTVLTGEQSAL